MSTAGIRTSWRALGPNHNRTAKSGGVSALHSAEEMAAILERERSRSDRTQIGFSLLCIVVGGRTRASASLTRIATFLRTRIRLTDDVGFMDDHRLCVLQRWWDHRSGPVSAADLRAVLAGHGSEGVCVHRDSQPEPLSTLRSLVLSPGLRRAEVASGSPCRAPYQVVTF